MEIERNSSALPDMAPLDIDLSYRRSRGAAPCPPDDSLVCVGWHRAKIFGAKKSPEGEWILLWWEILDGSSKGLRFGTFDRFDSFGFEGRISSLCKATGLDSPFTDAKDLLNLPLEIFIDQSTSKNARPRNSIAGFRPARKADISS